MNNKFSLNKDQKFGQIMGINVISTSISEVLTAVNQYLTHNVKFYIVTPNPELILMAQDNNLLKNALNDADLAIPDGVGLKLAIPSLSIIKGRELFMELIKLTLEKKWKVFLLGGTGEEAKLAAQKLENRYQTLKITSDPGWSLKNDGNFATEVDGKKEKDTVDRINEFSPDLLFVAFGNPKQEIWIHQNISKLNIKGAMAVGGTFRYVAGLSKLPPKWMGKLGLEWLFRLITEPYRIKRIFSAVVVFPLRLLKDRYTH